MQSYLVSLNVVTSSILLSEVSNRLGMQPSVGSYELGAPGLGSKKRPRTETLWRLNSMAAEDAGLEEHLQSIWDRIPNVLLTERDSLPSDCAIWLDIAMYYPEETMVFPPVRIASSWIQALSK